MSLRRHFVRENLRLPYKEDGTVTKSVFFHGILKRYGDPQTRGYSGLQKIRFQSDGYPWWFLFTSFERSYGRFLSQMFPRFQYHVLRVFKFKYWMNVDRLKQGYRSYYTTSSVNVFVRCWEMVTGSRPSVGVPQTSIVEHRALHFWDSQGK